jgi:hypothetical protein
MRRTRCAAGTTFLLACLALPVSAFAQIPPTMIASLGKQILQDIIFGAVKGELIGALAAMGCKGAAIAGLAAAADAGGAAGAARALTGGVRAPSPAGAAIRSTGPGGLPPGMGGMSGVGAMDPAMMQKAMEMMQQQNGMSPEQMAMVQKTMGQMQGAMSQPLSREETKAVFDEMAEMGLLTEKMRDEAKDCITYAPPGSGDSLGAAGAMLKTTVLPAARQAKERMAAATPEEQRQLADGMVDALNSASAADRKAFLDGLGAGFFPAPVVEQVRARVKP